MNIKEFRAGNSIGFVHNRLERPEEPDEALILSAEDLQYIEKDEDYQPLRITSSWLRDKGFTTVETDRTLSFFKNSLELKRVFAYGSMYDIYIRPFNSMPFAIKLPRRIHYVHQLENLYYDIHGKEL